jgi:hypothetical protein
MNLNEVKALFDELVDNVPSLEGMNFMIARSSVSEGTVDGYEIHMDGKKLDDQTLKHLHDIALKRKLSFDQRKDAVGIYQPKATMLQ